MTSPKPILGVGLLTMAFWCSIAVAQVDVSASAHSQSVDLTATPNSVDDNHSFDNSIIAKAVTPTTTTAGVEMAHATASGSVTASEGLFQALATSTYSNTGLSEAAQTDVPGLCLGSRDDHFFDTAGKHTGDAEFFLELERHTDLARCDCGRRVSGICQRQLHHFAAILRWEFAEFVVRLRLQLPKQA